LCPLAVSPELTSMCGDQRTACGAMMGKLSDNM
jgi:hypothetical protein